MISDALGRWTAADLAHVFPSPSALREEERSMYGDATRGWIVWRVLEHEIHYGGELSLALGKYGLPGIYGGMQ